MSMTRRCCIWAEVLKVAVQDLFPPRTPGNRTHEFIEKLDTTRF
ncbi:MAG TPA: hypothetical protein VK993_06030 [Chthoniobacterales bacterium]|nr:hypothetical protein [Chthoniobacterales bacterium]